MGKKPLKLNIKNFNFGKFIIFQCRKKSNEEARNNIPLGKSFRYLWVWWFSYIATLPDVAPFSGWLSFATSSTVAPRVSPTWSSQTRTAWTPLWPSTTPFSEADRSRFCPRGPTSQAFPLPTDHQGEEDLGGESPGEAEEVRVELPVM